MKEDTPFFQTLMKLIEGNGTFHKRAQQSIDWYRQKLSSIVDRKIDPSQLFNQKNYPNKPRVGNIITFKYNPVGVETLPYYDMFPMVLVLKFVTGGFIGLNFHYLNPRQRAVFMDRLMQFQKYSRATETVTINIKYEMLVNNLKLRYYKPCIKRYRTNNISKMVYTILPEEWEIAMFLPTENFVGKKKTNVWLESSKEIQKLAQLQRKK